MDIEKLERQEIQKKQRLVAGLFLLAIALAMLFAYWMGAFGFGASRAFYVDYNFAGGLERGSTVRLAGIKVGRVSEIRFSSEKGVAPPSDVDPQAIAGPAQLRLKIEVSTDAFKQITTDTKFFINLAGLIGERYVEVVPGTGAPVERGHEFRGMDPPRIDQLLSQGYGIFGDLRSFFQENRGDLKEIFNTLNSLSKNLATVFGNVTPQQKRELSLLLSNLAVASGDLKTMTKNIGSGLEFLGTNGGREAWVNLKKLLEKGGAIHLNDLRRLMLEDGVRVRFGKNEVPTNFSKEAESTKKDDK
jgi:phospholipid/cholesterol/gamma-HCH transport system substrate-binding protein